VPENVKDQMDLRMRDKESRDSENPYPATLFYSDGKSIPVFIHSIDDLLEIIGGEDYRDFHQNREDWLQHTEYDEFYETMSDSRLDQNTSFFAIPHLLEQETSGTYFPEVEDMLLVNEVDNFFADNYDNSDLDTTGNAATKSVM
ncbi:MAG: hypothetical protein V5A72_02760, partial [Candidatus Nanohaloarchaea archaeon]